MKSFKSFVQESSINVADEISRIKKDWYGEIEKLHNQGNALAAPFSNKFGDVMRGGLSTDYIRSKDHGGEIVEVMTRKTLQAVKDVVRHYFFDVKGFGAKPTIQILDKLDEKDYLEIYNGMRKEWGLPPVAGIGPK